MNGKLSLLWILNRQIRSHLHFWSLWVAGVVTGTLFVFCAPSPVATFVQSALDAPVALIGLLSGLTIPLIIVWLAQCTGIYWPVYLFLAGKGLVFGSLLGAVLFVFQPHSWLIAIFYLFSNIIMTTPILLLCKKIVIEKSGYTRQLFRSYIVTALTVVSLDYFLISPFLQILLSK